jgi:hypothetical protein
LAGGSNVDAHGLAIGHKFIHGCGYRFFGAGVDARPAAARGMSLNS